MSFTQFKWVKNVTYKLLISDLSDDSILYGYKEIIKNLIGPKGEDGIQLKLANNLFIAKGYGLIFLRLHF